MSTIFDQLTKLSQQNLESPQEEENKDSIPLLSQLEKIAEDEKNLPSKPERIAQQTGRKFLSQALHSPAALFDFLRHGSEYVAGKGEEQAALEGRLPSEEELKFTKNVVNALGLPSKLLEKYAPNYTPENIEKKNNRSSKNHWSQSNKSRTLK